jgi:uncharacterized protein (DUF433 family)
MARARKSAVEVRKGVGGESAYIADTRVRVSDIVRLYEIAREEVLVEYVQRALPHLSFEQIAGALAYYRANQSQIDSEMEEEDEAFLKIPYAG